MLTKGDRLEQFCIRVYPDVVGVLYAFVGDRYLAEELAKDAFVKLCRDWVKVQHMDSPEAWVRRVALNRANSYSVGRPPSGAR